MMVFKKSLLSCTVCWFFCLSAQAQHIEVKRVEPPSWWVGMKDPHLQLMVYGQNISDATASIGYSGVTLEKTHKADSPDYLFLDLTIDGNAKPGSVPIHFTWGNKKGLVYQYPLEQREPGRRAQQGLDPGDVIYLITPDRFVDGDLQNDEVPGLKEGKNRSFEGGRHGGDLLGIMSKLGYVQHLGATTLWLNPVLLNDMPRYSYHGYAITDYYKVDPRFGSNMLYKQLADSLHGRHMKLVMDMVFNHCGLDHWWMHDLPFKDWVHGYPNYVLTNHAMASFSDPHAARSDWRQMEAGWFVPSMPDLNQSNPFMARYLIQNSIWWIEYAGLDGIRMDTYPYNNPEMMARWAQRVYLEYPQFYLLGETWTDEVALESFWTGKSPADTATFNSHLNTATDFPLCMAMRRAFGEGGDINELYKVLSQDFLYYRPGQNTIFASNHDMDRLYYVLGQRPDKFKLAMAFLLTTRGIPEIYYGSEILMAGHGNDGIIRQDFPGGWPGDQRDAFVASGRTAQENEAFNYMQKLLNWRKTSDAIKTGTLKHFVPYNNVYVYNRKSDKQSVLVLINNSDNAQTLPMMHFEEVLSGYDKATNVMDGQTMMVLDSLTIGANRALIWELGKK